MSHSGGLTGNDAKQNPGAMVCFRSPTYLQNSRQRPRHLYPPKPIVYLLLRTKRSVRERWLKHGQGGGAPEVPDLRVARRVETRIRGGDCHLPHHTAHPTETCPPASQPPPRDGYLRALAPSFDSPCRVPHICAFLFFVSSFFFFACAAHSNFFDFPNPSP